VAAQIALVGLIVLTRESNEPVTHYESKAVSSKGTAQAIRVASLATPVETASGASHAVSLRPPNTLAIIPHGITSPIDSHQARILFRMSDLIVPAVGWNVQPLGRNHLYYVDLNHDLVTFDTGGASNPQINFPSGLPHPPVGSDHHVHPLLPAYSMPPYSSATIVRFTQGIFTVCETDEGRLDSVVTIAAKNTLAIRSGTKVLKLNPNANLTIVNATPAYISNPQPMMVTGHWMEYCVMQGVATTACNQATYPSASSCGWDHMLTSASVIYPMPSALAAHKSKTAESTMGGSADCSNTQWP
jgi:hypothetical protein